MLYEIILNENELNDYQVGRISGIIYVMSGMPDKGYPIKRHQDGGRCSMFFNGNAEILYEIQKTIDKLYPGVMVENID